MREGCRTTLLTLSILIHAPCQLACSKETSPRSKEETAASSKPAAKAVKTPSPLSKKPQPESAPTQRPVINGPRAARLKWVFRTEGRIYAAPAVGPDGTIYVASHDGHLYAVGQGGRQLWAFDAMGKIWSSPAIAADGTIYFGSDADKLFALSKSGTVKWVFSTEMPLEKGQKKLDSRWDVDTAPAIAADGTVYFGCHYYLYALRPSGEVRWRFQAGLGRVKIFSSPVVGKTGNIFFGTQGKRLFALNPNGEAIWNIETEADNDSTPAVGPNGIVYFGSDDGKLRAVRETSGDVIWQTSLETPIRADLTVSNGVVIASTYGSKPYIAAFDATNGTEKWRFSIAAGDGAFYGIQSGALVDGEGFVYFGGRDHFVYCLSPEGKLVWKYETGDQVDSNPVLGQDGTLYIGSDDKRLYAFAPQ